MFALFLVFLGVFGLIQAADYQFALKYRSRDLLTDPKVQDAFIRDVVKYEGRFNCDGYGFNAKSGMTFDGLEIDPVTLEGVFSARHNFSAASKEGPHLSLLAQALDDPTGYAAHFFAQSACGKCGVETMAESCSMTDHILTILDNKAKTLESFNAEFPGFGGFMPWYAIDPETGHVTPTWDWTQRVPSLDNGQLAWGLFTIVVALEKHGYNDMAKRYRVFVDRMAENALTVFFDADRKVFRTVTEIVDPKVSPKDTFYMDGGDGGALDDPYEGELFVLFCDFFCDWTKAGFSQDVKEEVWKNRRAKLVSVTYPLPEGYTTPLSKEVTVQQGYWFSSHEQWKTWVLPYSDTYAHTLFRNGEIVRTINSASKHIPGFYASVANTMDDQYNCYNMGGYISALGVPEIASQAVLCKNVITPYGATPLLADAELRPVGLVWYAAMINGTRMQGPHGSTEASDLTGNDIANVLTWDSKITSVVGMTGGPMDLAREGMKKVGVYDRFVEVINREYGLVFPKDQLKGLDVKPALPTALLPAQKLL